MALGLFGNFGLGIPKSRRQSEVREAARLRDEVKRLRDVELAVADDPLARQEAVQERAGKAGKRNGGGRRIDPMSRPHKPTLDEMGPHSERVVPKKRPRISKL